MPCVRSLEGTSKEQGCSCETDDGVWNVDSIDDQETDVAEITLLKFSQGLTRKGIDKE